ncbi:MAG: hypothetical protein ACRYGF_13695 [Janthinobacterium lividum]
MAARFSDHKRLALTYSNLLDLGIPPQSMRAQFNEVAVEPQPASEHRSFLARLYEWVQLHHASNFSAGPTEREPPKPTIPLFKEGGGLLEIDAVGRESAAVAVVVHHFGELID